MRFSDLLHPERVAAYVAKVFCGVLVLLLVPTLIANLTSTIHFSTGERMVFCLVLVAVSPAAYLIREHRRRGRPRGRVPRRGAERTPVLPQDRGEE
jgi:hypothetical protein